MDLWNRVSCPACKISNWFHIGDFDDCTVPDTEGYQCCICGHKWLAVPKEDIEWKYLDGDQIAAGERVEDHIYYERGLERP